jgi:hypothetical protein
MCSHGSSPARLVHERLVLHRHRWARAGSSVTNRAEPSSHSHAGTIVMSVHYRPHGTRKGEGKHHAGRVEADILLPQCPRK